MKNYRWLILWVMSALFLLPARSAWAQIFSSIIYDHIVNSSSAENIVEGFELPVNKTITVNPGFADAVATYQFSDNGLVAQLDISCTLTFNGYNEYASEDSDSSDYFMLTQPVTYTLTVQNSSGSNISANNSGELSGVDVPTYSYDLSTNQTYQTSGTLLPDMLYYLEEGSGASNFAPAPSATGVVTTSFDLTLTAIPEPAGLSMVLGVGAVAFPRRRKFG